MLRLGLGPSPTGMVSFFRLSGMGVPWLDLSWMANDNMWM